MSLDFERCTSCLLQDYPHHVCMRSSPYPARHHGLVRVLLMPSSAESVEFVYDGCWKADPDDDPFYSFDEIPNMSPKVCKALKRKMYPRSQGEHRIRVVGGGVMHYLLTVADRRSIAIMRESGAEEERKGEVATGSYCCSELAHVPHLRARARVRPRSRACLALVN